MRRDSTLIHLALSGVCLVVINSACGGETHRSSVEASEPFIAVDGQEVPFHPVLDCSMLPEYLEVAGRRMSTDIMVFSHNWNLRFRTPEEMLCAELSDGLTQPGEKALARLAELRLLDHFIVSFKTGGDDAVAAALAASVPIETRFIEVIGADTLACRFSHLESLGKGPWSSKLLLAFDHDTTAADRVLIITEVPGITDLRIQLPMSASGILGHRLATKDFLRTSIGT